MFFYAVFCHHHKVKFERLHRISCILLLSFTLSAPISYSQVVKNAHRFTVIAHRGAHDLTPENSLAGIKRSIALGVDYVEIDLRTSLDGTLMIMHNGSVQATTNGIGDVKSLTWKQLRQMNIIFKGNTTSEKIPSFDEVLDLCKDRIKIYLDFKDADVAKTWNTIVKHGMKGQVIVYCNDELQLNQWHNLVPQMPLIISLPSNVTTPSMLYDLLEEYAVAYLDGDYKDYTKEMVAVAKNKGCFPWPDIQNEKERDNWPYAIELGFDGLQTDHPAELIEWLTEKGLR